MEGTRHEKAILIIVAYVIGFTTAYIAFGVVKANKEPFSFQYGTSAYEQKASASDFNTSVVIKDDGLYAVTDNFDRILTADKRILDSSALASDEEVEGYYYRIVDAEVSRNARFVYYCEQLSLEATSCIPFVYDIASDSLHKVEQDGSAAAYPVDTHASVWLEDGNLSINGAASQDPNNPWALISEGI